MLEKPAKPSTVQTGIAEFDNILGGGLTPFRSYLLQGSPGSGKTTLSLQFLLEGAKQNEAVLYITLSESAAELRAVAASHGFSLDGVNIVELIPEEGHLEPENQITMYQPSEIELNVTIKRIVEAVETLSPKRVIIDSLSEIKLLAQSTLRFRRQVLALKQFFAGRSCTVFLLDDKTSSRDEDLQLESIAHGVISLEQLSPEYGAERRRLRVIKLRGQKYRGGFHDFSIVQGGLKVFPRIVAQEHAGSHETKTVRSGVPEMDALLGGGIQSGSSVLLLGPAGVGKSSLAIQYAVEAAKRGEASVLFTFDERRETMLARAEGLNMPLREFIDTGLIEVRAIDPAELSPGEFAHMVRLAVDGKTGNPVRIVLIDSLNGYLNAMPEERFLTAQLHELLTYLGHRDVVTFLVVAQHGLLSHAMTTTIDTSYLADTVILFRYFEAAGEVKQLLSVLKKRNGQHERTIREFSLGANGVQIGEPLTKFHGVLTGTPIFQGTNSELIFRND
ncbi:gas vesicle protein GvpD [Asticcacaulis sp. ZE23SCel15]|uniref:ATPase domain-containing protein n=1 Tax=Asticcacaulis sp. ZE23SCel15 TaxID=3059027 RepID=UPI00265DBF02|nr:ATPase domain-containing protein [Asticcacaulis sp. ZE23SCel15]WKL56714.1 gas vesicle protein GvpD [Asticcacaulis sp. ZE23SCel15]